VSSDRCFRRRVAPRLEFRSRSDRASPRYWFPCPCREPHFFVPELDAGNQIIRQSTFTVTPGTPLETIKRQGEGDHVLSCLVEGLRRGIDREVELHFHRVIRREPGKK